MCIYTHMHLKWSYDTRVYIVPHKSHRLPNKIQIPSIRSLVQIDDQGNSNDSQNNVDYYCCPWLSHR